MSYWSMSNLIVNNALSTALHDKWFFLHCENVDQVVTHLCDAVRPTFPLIDRNIVKGFVSDEIRGILSKIWKGIYEELSGSEALQLGGDVKGLERLFANLLCTDFDFNESFDYEGMISAFVHNELRPYLEKQDVSWVSDELKKSIAEMRLPTTTE